MKKAILILTLMLTLAAHSSVFDESVKLYSKPADSLYMTVLSALSQSKYKISELQSKNGYVLFLDGAQYYLLTVTKRYQNQTEVKVLPQNSDFSKGSSVAKNVFALIDNELKNPLELVK